MDKKLDRTNELLEQLLKRSSLSYRFLQGLVQSLGATIGLAIFIAIISSLLSNVELIPLIGGWLSDVANETISKTNVQQFITK